MLAELEVVVVDGGSSDSTLEIARGCSERTGRMVLLETPAGRGRQISAGIESSGGEGILILHADSLPSPAMINELGSFLALDPDRQRSCAPTLFRLRFDRDSPLLQLYARAARLESILTSFGDQGLLIGRDQYEKIGPIRPIPLFEDVDFLRRARDCLRVRKSSAEIITSARRFDRYGVVRTQVQNMLLLFSFLRGADPVELQRNYNGRAYVENPHIGGHTGAKRRNRADLTHCAASETLSTTQKGEEGQ